MINKLTIHKTATYDEKVEMLPSEINYLYGSNGSGKTTISNVIANPDEFIDCSIEWSAAPLHALVYNREFIGKNFDQSSSIKGIFTLGKDSKDAIEFIEKTKKDIDSINNDIVRLKTSLENIDKKKNETNDDIINKCWIIKCKYDELFKPAFTGHIRTKQMFLEKCLLEQNNTSELLKFEDINGKCKEIFNNSKNQYPMIHQFVYPELAEKESNEILSIKIIGKEDAQIGALISRLNNSDWVNEGVGYLKNSEDKCPFCQQHVSELLKSEIGDFFDESYDLKCKELETFRIDYSNYITRKTDELKGIIKDVSDIKIIKLDGFSTNINLIEEIFKTNIALINSKIKSPSITITLESLYTEFRQVENIIESFRNEIKNNNELVANISKEKATLTSLIWRFITSELQADFNVYQRSIEGIKKGEKSIQDSLKEKDTTNKLLESQVKQKETEVTSIIHTINEINKTLKLFGFHGFKIMEASKQGFYKIVREDNTDVNNTLSEGEYTFITFLYFYQLLKGSIEESGITRDKIVVIDDPVSSLDSNVLFIVSNLIKNVISDCKNQKNGIKQIFILTHNVYFHKEVTFKGSGKSNSKMETFWIVRKLDNLSSIVKCDKNPIKTTYELLWRELDDVKRINKATIFNTLRRILEYYFNIIGGLDYEKCINEFGGEEMLICKSLVSWINDGSHFINDDLDIYAELESIEKYICVFESIFDKMGHLSHYKMMMNSNCVAVDVASS